VGEGDSSGGDQGGVRPLSRRALRSVGQENRHPEMSGSLSTESPSQLATNINHSNRCHVPILSG
jgi:hypothetical protein